MKMTIHNLEMTTREKALLHKPVGNCFVEVKTIEALKAVEALPVNIAVWDRVLPLDLCELNLEFDLKVGKSIFSANVVDGFGEIEKNLAFLKRFKSREAADWLLKDICKLAEHFAIISKNPDLGVVLETVKGDQCRRLHIDKVPLRLITTYCGQGTQWIPSENVDISLLNSDEYIESLENSDSLMQLNAGQVGIFKGSYFPGNSNNPIVHRSPHIEGTDQIRLLLRFDML